MFHGNHATIVSSLFTIYEKELLSNYCVQNPQNRWLLLQLKKRWRPGRDSDPGPTGDSRIYWTELYYLGIKRRKNTNNFS